LGPAKLSTKADVVYDQLRRAIVSGEMVPGERLDQKLIADTLGVSTMPLRQALMRLAEQHLIEIRPHHGAVVAPLTVEGFDELYAMRSAMESMVARRAADHVTPDVVVALKDLYESQVSAVESGQYFEYVELDRQFHSTLYGCAQMSRALHLIEELRDSSDRYIRWYVAHRQRGSESLKEHQRIIKAATSRDAEKLERLTRQHVLGGSKDLLAIIAESSDVNPAFKANDVRSRDVV
jgi:DNA-binding GntR family transcriptional regulator